MSVRELRISFVWAQALPVASVLRCYEVWSAADYYDYAQECRKSGGTFCLPWSDRADPISHFWQRYLECTSSGLHGCSAKTAWHHYAPLRLATPTLRVPECREADSRCRLVFEGYVHPGGIAVVATVYIRCERSFSDAVSLALRCYGEPWVLGSDRASLSQMAQIVAEDLRKKSSTGDIGDWEELPPPYSVATFIDLSECHAVVDDGDEIHRGLEALYQWNRISDWRTKPSQALQGCRFDRLSARRGHATMIDPAANILYGGRAGHVVWFPTLACVSDDRRRHVNLGRFHRNQTMAMMQVDAVVAFLEALSPYIARQVLPVGQAWQLCTNVSGLCARMFHYSKSTYNTAGAFRRLRQHIHTINAARRYVRPQSSLLQ